MAVRLLSVQTGQCYTGIGCKEQQCVKTPSLYSVSWQIVIERRASRERPRQSVQSSGK